MTFQAVLETSCYSGCTIASASGMYDTAADNAIQLWPFRLSACQSIPSYCRCRQPLRGAMQLLNELQ